MHEQVNVQSVKAVARASSLKWFRNNQAQLSGFKNNFPFKVQKMDSYQMIH